MLKLTSTCIAAALLAFVPTLALAQPKPKPIGTFDAWQAFTLPAGKGNTCYIVGRPKSKEPENVKRSDAYVLVSHRPADKIRNEVSVNAGYPLKKGGKVEAVVGSETFDLMVFDNAGYEETAWAPDGKVEQALVNAMSKGSTMVVKGTSAKGNSTKDTYSLSGIGAALKAIGEACK